MAQFAKKILGFVIQINVIDLISDHYMYMILRGNQINSILRNEK